MGSALSLDMLDAAIQACPDGFVLTREGRYVYANSAWARLLGRDPDELEGREVTEDVHPDFRARLLRWLKLGGARSSAEFSFMRASGSIAVFHLSPLESDGATGFIARDLTEVKRLQAKQLLADRMMSVGALAAGVAHEINNPLSYVLGNLTYVGEECDTTDGLLPEARRMDVKEALDEALEGADRIKRIVGGLQSFSRADHETMDEVDINDTIRTAINMSWIEIRNRARLVKSFGELPSVRANDATLGQVFLNLLLNAAHALPVGKARDNEIRLETFEDDEQVVVRIGDTGPGIPAEVVDHVFDTFFTKAPPGVGSGLALSISHTIVTELGGTISVSSGSKGTVFEVRLPAYQPVPAAQADEAPRRARADGRRRILVIDDEELIVSSIKRALRSHDVHTATSGHGAVDILEEDTDFDVIFCDLMMPDMSGMDVYRWIKANRPGLERTVIFLTGHIFHENAIEFLRSVENKRVNKPFELDMLRRLVSEESP